MRKQSRRRAEGGSPVAAGRPDAIFLRTSIHGSACGIRRATRYGRIVTVDANNKERLTPSVRSLYATRNCTGHGQNERAMELRRAGGNAPAIAAICTSKP